MKRYAYHKASRKAAQKMLKEGLPYGTKGKFANEGNVPALNDYLNRCCPEKLRGQKVSRLACLYGYLCMGDMVLDVDTGRWIVSDSWQVKPDEAVVRLAFDDHNAFIGDLVLFDEMKEIFGDEKWRFKLQELASEYWQRFLPLRDVYRYYHPVDKGMSLYDQTETLLPVHYDRVEVLIAADIPPEDIVRIV